MYNRLEAAQGEEDPLRGVFGAYDVRVTRSGDQTEEKGGCQTTLAYPEKARKEPFMESLFSGHRAEYTSGLTRH